MGIKKGDLMKPLRHSNKDYDGELKVGDVVIYQSYKMEVIENDMTAVTIEMLRIEDIDENGTRFRPEGYVNYYPTYRIRQVVDVENSLTYQYKGYDYDAIMRDEGQITDKTYNEIKKLKETRSVSSLIKRKLDS